MLLCHVSSFFGGGRSSFVSSLFCAVLPCVLVSVAGVVGGTFELAGGGVEPAGAEPSLGASSAGTAWFAWGIPS